MVDIYSKVETRILDPTFHYPVSGGSSSETGRTQFDIPSEGKVLLSNMRLCNVGFYRDLTSSAYTRINALAGYYAHIKQIDLWSEGTLIDSIPKFNQLVAFWMTRHANTQLRDEMRTLAGVGLGFCLVEWADFYSADNAYYNEYYGPRTQEAAPRPPTAVIPGDDNGRFAVLDLSHWMGLLKASKVLANFKRLTLVIEYDSRDFTAIPYALEAPADVPRPFLIYDEVIDEGALTKYLGAEGRRNQGTGSEPVTYTAWVSDQTFFPAGSAQLLFQPRGAHNHRVTRMLIQTEPVSLGSVNRYPEACGRLGSLAQKDWSVNVRLNGRQVIPLNSINSPNLRESLLDEAFGPADAFPGSNIVHGTDVAGTTPAPSSSRRRRALY